MGLRYNRFEEWSCYKFVRFHWPVPPVISSTVCTTSARRSAPRVRFFNPMLSTYDTRTVTCFYKHALKWIKPSTRVDLTFDLMITSVVLRHNIKLWMYGISNRTVGASNPRGNTTGRAGAPWYTTGQGRDGIKRPKNSPFCQADIIGRPLFRSANSFFYKFLFL